MFRIKLIDILETHRGESLSYRKTVEFSLSTYQSMYLQYLKKKLSMFVYRKCTYQVI